MPIKVQCDRCGEEFLKEQGYVFQADELDIVFCPDCGKEAQDIYGEDLDPNEIYPEMIGG